MFCSCIHLGSTWRPSASLSSLDWNVVWCWSKVIPQLQWCFDWKPVQLFRQLGALRHLRLPLGSWSWHECLHKHFRSWDPTESKSINQQQFTYRRECNQTFCTCISCRELGNRSLESLCCQSSAPCTYDRRNTGRRVPYSYSQRHHHSSKWRKVDFYELLLLILYMLKILVLTSLSHYQHFPQFSHIRCRPEYASRPNHP